MPQHKVNSITPVDHISHCTFRPLVPSRISGAIQFKVPLMPSCFDYIDCYESNLCLMKRDKPKSINLNDSMLFSSSNTFSSFTSACTMLRECKYFKARKSCEIIWFAMFSGTGKPRLLQKLSRSPPWQNLRNKVSINVLQLTELSEQSLLTR